MDRSSRVRMGTLDSILSMPPRCIRNVRSLTLPISTPSTVPISATISSTCSLPRVAMVTSTCSRRGPEAVTSSPVTSPPMVSIAAVSSLTAVARAGSSSRTVMEFETEGPMFMGPILPATCRYSESALCVYTPFPAASSQSVPPDHQGGPALVSAHSDGDGHRREGDAEPELESLTGQDRHHHQHDGDEPNRQPGQNWEGPHAHRRFHSRNVELTAHPQLRQGDYQVDEESDGP